MGRVIASFQICISLSIFLYFYNSIFTCCITLVGGGSDDSAFFVFLKVFFCIFVFACCMTLVGGGSGDSPRSPPYHTQAASVGGTREAKLLTHKIVVFLFSYSVQFFYI